MIKRNVTVKLQGSRAVVDSPIYLYQYDKNICLVITLLNNRYEYDKDTRLSFTLVKPNGATVESSLSAIIQGKYYITLTGEMLDGAEEIGQNLIQIRQHSDKGVVSLPPFAIHILRSYVQPTSVDGIEDVLLTENEYMLLTENQRAIEVFGTVKISELPTTTDIIGYVPITQDGTTYKLDISDFATKEDVANVTIDLSPYATKEEVNAKADKEHNHDEDYADINHNHDTVYAKLGDLEHNHDTQYAPINHKHDNDYAPKQHEHSQYLTEHQDISHLASQAYVKNEIANAQLGGEGTEIDLSGYATKDDLLVKADKEHTHSQYLTQHQDISHLATKQELVHNHDNQYAPKTHTHEQYLTEHQNISHLATKEELVHNHDTQYAPISHEHEQYLTEHQSLTHLATKADILNKSDKGHTHSYNDLLDKPTIPSVDGLASEDYVDNAVANVKVDTSHLATKQEVQAKADENHNHDTVYAPIVHEHDNYLTEHQDISHLVSKEEFNAVATGIITSASIKSIELVDELPSEQQQGVLYIVKAGV